MRPITLAATLLLALAAPALAEDDTCTAYGKGVTLKTATAAATLLAEPAAWNGKEVRVDGTVGEVCMMSGCWMEIAAGQDAEPVKVRVRDGEIVFPVSARGHQAQAQGVVEVRELTRDQYVQQQQHLAEELGNTFDAAAVGPGPFRTVQVQGTGAVICP